MNLQHRIHQDKTERSPLVGVFEKHGLDLTSLNVPLSNVVTGQVFDEKIAHDVKECEKIGEELYESFLVDRLQEDSKTDVHTPLKKVSLKLFTSANKSTKMKVNDRIVELKGNCNLFAKCAILKDTRAVDMTIVIGNHELTSVPRSLMNNQGHLIPGAKGKAELVAKVIGHTKVQYMTDISAECIAIDAMYLLNQISPILKYVKTGKDLANEFCKRVEKLTMNASLVIVAFDNYTKDIENVSLKTGTRVMRNEKKGGKGKPARHHEIRSDTNISKLKMSDLAHSKTKKALTFLLAASVTEHLQQQNKMFVVAHDIEAQFSLGHDANYKININHEEADTMLIYCLANCPLSDLSV